MTRNQDIRLEAMQAAIMLINEWEDNRWPNGAPLPSEVVNAEIKLLLVIGRQLRQAIAGS